MSQYDSNIHHRHSMRLPGYDYSRQGLYFITICAQNRECRFGKIENEQLFLNEIGEIVEKCWISIPQHFPNAVLHQYVIMPNHLHGIIEVVHDSVGVENFQPLPTPSSPLPAQHNAFQHSLPRSISSMIRGFKIGITKKVGYSICQRNFYEHIIRNEEEYLRIADYIYNNSKNWEEDRFFTENHP